MMEEDLSRPELNHRPSSSLFENFPTHERPLVAAKTWSRALAATSRSKRWNAQHTHWAREALHMFKYKDANSTAITCTVESRYLKLGYLRNSKRLSESKIHFNCVLQPKFGVGDFFTSPNYLKWKLICTLGNSDLLKMPPNQVFLCHLL